MNDPAVLAVAADVVLLLHAAVVLFVVGGLPLIVLGNWTSRRRPGAGRVVGPEVGPAVGPEVGPWVNSWTFRGLHAAAIAIVVAEAWLGVECPLTTLETALRLGAGQRGYGGSGFIAHWVGGVLYWDLPGWVFTALYSAFGAAVAAAWWRWPPGR